MSEQAAQWLAERRKGIGGSDAAAVCGVSPYRTPLQVWQDKREASEQKPDTDAMLWGRILEAPIRQRYADVTGRSVKIPDGILYHQQHDFMLANIDGFTDEGRGVEIKTTSSPKDWGEPGTDEIPLPHIFQVQHYMAVTGFTVFDVPVLIGGRDFRIYEVHADADLQAMMIEREAAFWRLVQEAIPPDPVNYEDVVRRYRQSQPMSLMASLDVEGQLVRLKSLREQIDALEVFEQEARTAILGAMGEHDTLVAPDGRVLATWKSGKAPKRLDIKALEKEQPEMYQQYLKPGEASRRFLVK
jgi:putative phage-type endonuclease